MAVSLQASAIHTIHPILGNQNVTGGLFSFNILLAPLQRYLTSKPNLVSLIVNGNRGLP